MPYYLFRASYSQAGIQGVLKEGAASRSAVVSSLAESLGGRLVANYWAFGEDDYFGIIELPDDEAAAAAAMTVAASGTGSITTVKLLTAEQVDEARARRPAYRAPGA